MLQSGKNISISFFLLLVLILPMGIGLGHAMHQHESNICLAVDESHFHAETIDCEQLHYFSQTVTSSPFISVDIHVKRVFFQKEYFSPFILIHSFSKADPDRGPPVITVL